MPIKELLPNLVPEKWNSENRLVERSEYCFYYSISFQFRVSKPDFFSKTTCLISFTKNLLKNSLLRFESFPIEISRFIILRHNENMESKIFLSNRCIFLPDLCQMSSRKRANIGCSRVQMSIFFMKTGNFSVEFD